MMAVKGKREHENSNIVHGVTLYSTNINLY